MKVRYFIRNPWMFIILGIFILVNNFYEFVAAIPIKEPLNNIIPIGFILAGMYLYILKAMKKQA